MFKLGDRVIIRSSKKTGSICDVRIVNGIGIYIVDCFGECDSDEVSDCVITVNENEIDPIE